MIYAGCDLGISAAKVVIAENKTILAYEIVPYRSSPHTAAAMALEGALQKAGISGSDIVSCMGCGFGKKVIFFADQRDSKVLCLLRALRYLNPRVKTIIDVGGHDILASNIDEDWMLIQPAKVEDCASGTGLFVEMITRAMEFPMEDLATGSISSENPVQMSNTCVIFAESAVISRINEGYDRYDVFAGVTQAVAAKLIGIVGRVDIIPEVAMTGGIAKFSAVTSKLESHFGIKLADLKGVDPQIVTAFGAALLAEENISSGENHK